MRPAPIIPLAQVPDDPGPEPEDAELATARGAVATNSSAFPVKLRRSGNGPAGSGVPAFFGIAAGRHVLAVLARRYSGADLVVIRRRTGHSQNAPAPR
jgi:hypothetical protein